MEKVIVIGCPGSGKSTFSRELYKITGLPVFYLDMIYHKPDKTTVSNREFDEKLGDILNQDKWIIDGNYSRTLPLRLDRCDTVFWLDYPTEICLNGVESRIGKPRVDMPWIETEKDEEFIEYIKSFNSARKPEIENLLRQSKNKSIYIFNSREAAAKYLETLSADQ